MSKRIDWLDIAKGIGIILVILGHAIFPKRIVVWIYTFHMPLFFYLSGVTFNLEKYNKFSKLIKSKVKSLLVPYILLSILYLLFYIFQNYVFKYDVSILKAALGIIFQIRHSDYTIGLWFFPCLFVTEILFYILLKICGKSKIKLFIEILISFVIGYIYCRYVDVKLPWAVDASFIAVFFMGLGYIMKDMLNKIDYRYMAFIIINVLFGNLNYKTMWYRCDMYYNWYGNGLFYILSAVSGIIFIISVSKLINKAAVLQAIGKNSLYYYGVHKIILDIIAYLISKYYLYNDTLLSGLCIGTVSLGITIIILYPMQYKFMNMVKAVQKRMA